MTSTRSLLLYPLPILAGGYFQFIVANYLMKYSTDILLFPAAFVGGVFFFSRIWDALNDPLIGYLNDREKQRFGHRKFSILISAPLLALSFAAIWYSPQWTDTGNKAWFTVMVFLFFTLLTFLFVPHYSIGAEIANSKEKRMQLFGGRTIAENIGVIGAALSLGALVQMTGRTSVESFMVFAGLAGLVIIILPVYLLREKNVMVHSYSLGESLKSVLISPVMIPLVAVSFLNQTGASYLLAMSLYYTEYVLFNKDLGAVIPALFIISASISVPVWVKLGKKNLIKAWISGQAIMVTGLFLLLPGFELSGFLIYPAGALIGFGAGAALIYPPTIIAQIAEEGKDGTFFSVFTFMNKTGMAFAAFLSGIVLSVFQFAPNTLQSDFTIAGLSSSFVFIPVLFFCLAGFLIWYLKQKLQNV